nr:PQQ-binding-like beta-propeller repeat protein [Chloroflexota bacterium]
MDYQRILKKRGGVQRISLWAVVGILLLLLTACDTTDVATTTAPYVATFSAVSCHDTTPSGDWPMYLGNGARTSYSDDKANPLNATTAPNLKGCWLYQADSPISTQAVESDGRVYWGSWDGNEHATDLLGKQVWKTNVGVAINNHCTPSYVGVASTAAVDSVMLNGSGTPMVFVGGGDANVYALNARTGAVIWKTSLGASPDHFIWSSPVVFNGSVYIGLASFGDCPLVQGRLFQLQASTGTVQHSFDVIPPECLGGGVWGSPAIDEDKQTIYIGVGEAVPCKKATPYADSMIELSASDLKPLGSWQVPAAEATEDGDFGSTPVLFEAKINGALHKMVGVVNKNGTFYTFERDNVAKGPVWKAKAAIAGTCPDCGGGTIAPAAWDGTALYTAGTQAKIDGKTCAGIVQALKPDTGATIWNKCLSRPVLGAVTLVPGVVI